MKGHGIRCNGCLDDITALSIVCPVTPFTYRIVTPRYSLWPSQRQGDDPDARHEDMKLVNPKFVLR